MSLRFSCRAIVLVAASLCLASAAQSQANVVRYVDPFLGVDGEGNVFPGATLPFGMVKLGPDTENLAANAGYDSASRIIGFSHVHVSGTGGGPKYGNILVTPVVGTVQPGRMGSGRTGEAAVPGYYTTKLTRYGISAEITTTHRVGVHRYTFPSSRSAHIAIDVAHCLTSAYAPEVQKFIGGEVQISSATELQGMGRYVGGWNEGGEYDVYFYAVFDTPARSSGTWTINGIDASRSDARSFDGGSLGAYFDYDTSGKRVIQAKVGISFVSIAKARENVRREVPNWNFDAIRKQASAIWNENLAKVVLHGASDEQSKALYTALYHNMLMPTDRTGENPKWQSSEPYYDDYYCLWDTFRTSNPLLTLIQPDREVDLVRSLIDIYRHTGYMPDARSGNYNGRTQGGSNAEVVVADALSKGLKGIDYETAFSAMVKDAEVPPPDPIMEGRGGLTDYDNRGYVTLKDERSGSRTMEYAYDDFAISQVANALGRKAEYNNYRVRAGNWRNLWDNSVVSEGVRGFIRPRQEDGSWLAGFSPSQGGTWPDFFYESDSWQYSLYVPQDVRELIAHSGGKEAFIKRLDTLFNNNHYDVTNEPGFLLPILYIWAGRHDRSADRIAETLRRYFTTNRNGLPGNDDSGAMSAWYAFHALGFFPIAGQDLYVISTPTVPEAEIDLGTGHIFRIVAKGLDPEHRNRYIRSATLNGAPLQRAWFRHAEIVNGGTLQLEMSEKPGGWGAQNPPPSMSD